MTWHPPLWPIRQAPRLASAGLGVRLGSAPDDELPVIQEVSCPCDVNGDAEGDFFSATPRGEISREGS